MMSNKKKLIVSVLISILALIGIAMGIAVYIANNHPATISNPKVSETTKSPKTTPWLYLDSHELSALVLVQLSKSKKTPVDDRQLFDMKSPRKGLVYTAQNNAHQVTILSGAGVTAVDLVFWKLTGQSIELSFDNDATQTKQIYLLKTIYTKFHGTNEYKNAYNALELGKPITQPTSLSSPWLNLTAQELSALAMVKISESPKDPAENPSGVDVTKPEQNAYGTIVPSYGFTDLDNNHNEIRLGPDDVNTKIADLQISGANLTITNATAPNLGGGKTIPGATHTYSLKKMYEAYHGTDGYNNALDMLQEETSN